MLLTCAKNNHIAPNNRTLAIANIRCPKTSFPIGDGKAYNEIWKNWAMPPSIITPPTARFTSRLQDSCDQRLKRKSHWDRAKASARKEKKSRHEAPTRCWSSPLQQLIHGRQWMHTRSKLMRSERRPSDVVGETGWRRKERMKANGARRGQGSRLMIVRRFEGVENRAEISWLLSFLATVGPLIILPRLPLRGPGGG